MNTHLETVQLPRVALIGRANVGKSTLFNRLAEQHRAIVSPMPGTTRDWNTANIHWGSASFELIDTGGLDQLGESELDRAIEEYARKAMEQSKVLVLVLDGRIGVTPEDRRLVKEMRKYKNRVIVAINKCDTAAVREHAQTEVFELGFTHVVMVSATNGSGTGDLLDEIEKFLPDTSLEQAAAEIKIAIVGRPNVGKSSFLNALVGEERALVSAVAHTTRDINQSDFTYKGKSMVLLDTAGIRKRSKLLQQKEGALKSIERESVHAAMTAIHQSDVIVLVLEAHKEVTDQDKRLGELIKESRRGVIIAINKWDLVEDKTPETINKYIKYFSAEFPFLSWAPMVFISSQTKQRLKDVLDLVLEIQTERKKRLTDDQCNEVLDWVKRKYDPKARVTVAHGKRRPELKLLGMTQIDMIPPTFIIYTPKPKHVAGAVVNLVEKHLRERYEFLGTPISITTQAKPK